MNVLLRGANKLVGRLRVPGDKSISHRALILGALAHGETEIVGPSQGRDVQATKQCLESLGVEFEVEEGEILVRGRGPGGLKPPNAPLDCGNSGTTMRILAGVLAGRPFQCTLVGDRSLSQRPMRRIIEPLRAMGAKVSAREDNFPPLTIEGGGLTGIRYEISVKSAQVKSCILLSGLQANGETVVIEPVPTRDHTERMLRYLGAPIEVEGKEIKIRPGELTARPIKVPGDFSSAAFVVAAACAIPGSDLLIEDVGMNPTRTGFLDVLREMGAKIEVFNLRKESEEPVASLRVRGAALRGVEVRGKLIPRLIDELPILFALATQARGTTLVRDAEELRVKESDRIAAMADNLRRLGAKVRELPDGMVVEGPTKLKSAELSSFSDHRVVMASAIAALFAEGQSVIREAEWADISFPGFFELLTEVSGVR